MVLEKLIFQNYNQHTLIFVSFPFFFMDFGFSFDLKRNLSYSTAFIRQAVFLMKYLRHFDAPEKLDM